MTPPDPGAPDAVAEVAKWTEADITPHPEFDAPARPSGPTKAGDGPGRMKSKAMWKWAFATHQPFAHRWARNTPGGKDTRYRLLPTRKSAPGAGSLR